MKLFGRITSNENFMIEKAMNEHSRRLLILLNSVKRLLGDRIMLSAEKTREITSNRHPLSCQLTFLGSSFHRNEEAIQSEAFPWAG